MSNFKFTPAVLMVMALRASDPNVRMKYMQLATARPQQPTAVNQRQKRKNARRAFAAGDRLAFCK